MGEKKLKLWVKINQRSMSTRGAWWRVRLKGPGSSFMGDGVRGGTGHQGGTQQLPRAPQAPVHSPEAALQAPGSRTCEALDA